LRKSAKIVAHLFSGAAAAAFAMLFCVGGGAAAAAKQRANFASCECSQALPERSSLDTTS